MRIVLSRYVTSVVSIAAFLFLGVTASSGRTHAGTGPVDLCMETLTPALGGGEGCGSKTEEELAAEQAEAKGACELLCGDPKKPTCPKGGYWGPVDDCSAMAALRCSGKTPSE